MIIGNKWTPVRKVVDRAAALVGLPKLCFAMVVDQTGLAGLFAGTPEGAWDEASQLSRKLHITYKEVSLGYRDPATIHLDDYANREDEGVLLVPKAGEMLYHLRNRPTWARET